MMFNFHVNQHLFYALARAASRPGRNARPRYQAAPATAQWGLSAQTDATTSSISAASPSAALGGMQASGADKNMQLYDRAIRRRLFFFWGAIWAGDPPLAAASSLPNTCMCRCRARR